MENKKIKNGLSLVEVADRNNRNLNNKTKVKVGKSYLNIIFTDLFSFFNVLLFIIAGLMIYAKKYDGLFFLVVLIPNIVITMYEDLHARVLLGKLSLVNQPSANVIRDGKEYKIKSEEIVLDEIIKLNGNAQICVDGTIIEGEILVNESLLTGESKPVRKKAKDRVFAGSFVISGDCYIETIAVGTQCYIETIHEKANTFKRTSSEIKSSLKKLFLGIGIIFISIVVATLIIYAFQGRFNTQDSIKYAIRTSISGSTVAMIPSGMYLLTSAVFALSVINLSSKNAHIQDFYSVEMLSKINILCVDKTGTITDGKLNVKEIKIFNSFVDENLLKSIVKSLVFSTKDNNETAKALVEYSKDAKLLDVKNYLAFNSDNKYSAITLMNGETYIVGAAEYINLSNLSSICSEISKLSSLGYRILTIGKNYSEIRNNAVIGQFEAIAILIIEDHIKDGVKDVFNWFKENDVQLKVISGDNALAVSTIAQEVGIENAENYISLENVQLENIGDLAGKYTVFGRVSPEQKEQLINALKAGNNKVAMTGDGVNDILALKRADCSIAMANGSDAARHISNIVLMNSDFNSLPNVVSEGRRIVNNLQRTCSLFLAKTMFAMFFSILFLAASAIKNDINIYYPFETNHLYLWEIFGIGMSAFFISLEKNEKKYSGMFMTNILKNAVPAGITVILSTSIVYLCGILQDNGVWNFGIINDGSKIAMASVAFSIIGLVILYKVCSPLNKYRGIVFGGACLLEFGIGFAAYLVTINQGTSAHSILRIPFEYMNGPTWFYTIVITLLCSGAYLLATYIMKVLKEKENVNN